MLVVLIQSLPKVCSRRTNALIEAGSSAIVETGDVQRDGKRANEGWAERGGAGGRRTAEQVRQEECGVEEEEGRRACDEEEQLAKGGGKLWS